ncbi:MAG: hypothetical protein IPP91_19495 [Betaproteobacteria bacterium]|nr:hypothetical protein [Betaproteobacteria bacterium]
MNSACRQVHPRAPDPEAIEAAAHTPARRQELSLDSSGKVLSASIVDGEVRLAVDEKPKRWE